MSLLTQSQMGQGGGQPMSIHPAILAAQQSAQQAAAAVAAATAAAAAASSHGSNVSAVGALNHHPSIEVGKKRTAENDVFPLVYLTQEYKKIIQSLLFIPENIIINNSIFMFVE